MEQIEGKICVEAALKARQRKISLLVIREGLHSQQIEAILNEAHQRHIPIKYVPREEIDAMAHGKTHGGIIALAGPKPLTPIETLLAHIAAKNSSHLGALLLLEGIDDSQNLGFTLRSAEALGIDGVLLKKHLWDFDSNSVARASSGAYERLPLVLLDDTEKMLNRLKNQGFTVYGCIAKAKRTIYDIDLTRAVVLAIGGEKRGLSAAVRKQCDRLISIPMVADIGSLSLSHAASIIMAELMRQRLQKTTRLNQSNSMTS
ncbi:MAG: 23S rRNA (guanosine(2251)-2'-O)-methyltransferase RlmB [candidate division KSB1 bacterium]|nr:23S rRNA (guanosine(2251)-2'-O)-methyltransferase RlmB [candidate division KSB1 bacterium]MDZ7356984.1 23S rRNA (guanosine(2251)-2'-O)-methyltransferase RlmB [candidate division KSB1 bacterium]MDZ7400954.1 23S rRNA (guanosine(2251)-2'-O)-methyltransferase RlmB [candidate division KSB1 bacterium]